MYVSSAFSTSVMKDHIQKYKLFFRCRIHPKKSESLYVLGCMYACVCMHVYVYV